MTPGELGAITAYFDQNGSGNIDVPDFLSKFFRISIVSKGMKGGCHIPGMYVVVVCLMVPGWESVSHPACLPAWCLSVADKPEAKKLLAEYRDKIKEAIRSKRYNFDKLKLAMDDPDGQGRPSPSSPHASGPAVPEVETVRSGGEAKKLRLPAATTPTSKLDRRLMRADHYTSDGSGGGAFMDLSTYKAENESDFKLSQVPSKVFDMHGMNE